MYNTYIHIDPSKREQIERVNWYIIHVYIQMQLQKRSLAKLFSGECWFDKEHRQLFTLPMRISHSPSKQRLNDDWILICESESIWKQTCGATISWETNLLKPRFGVPVEISGSIWFLWRFVKHSPHHPFVASWCRWFCPPVVSSVTPNRGRSPSLGKTYWRQPPPWPKCKQHMAIYLLPEDERNHCKQTLSPTQGLEHVKGYTG